MAAINPDSQSRLPASLRQFWCCRSGRIARLVPVGGEWDNLRPAFLFRHYPRKNPGRCDLLHITPVGPVLDRRHEQKASNLIRRAGRPPHRLCPDRHRRRGRPGCVGLPPAGLNPSRRRPACVISRALNTSARKSTGFIGFGIFPWCDRGRFWDERVPRKSVKRGACCDRQSSTILTERLIAVSFCFRFGPRRRFIPAPHPPRKIAKHVRPWP